MWTTRTLCFALALLLTGGWQQSAQPLWINEDGRPNARSMEALAVIGEAETHGLDPAFYRPSPEAMAGGGRFENEMTLGLTRYLQDLHQGRVDARALGLLIEKRTDSHLTKLILDFDDPRLLERRSIVS